MCAIASSSCHHLHRQHQPRIIRRPIRPCVLAALPHRGHRPLDRRAAPRGASGSRDRPLQEADSHLPGEPAAVFGSMQGCRVTGSLLSIAMPQRLIEFHLPRRMMADPTSAMAEHRGCGCGPDDLHQVVRAARNDLDSTGHEPEQAEAFFRVIVSTPGSLAPRPVPASPCGAPPQSPATAAGL